MNNILIHARNGAFLIPGDEIIRITTIDDITYIFTEDMVFDTTVKFGNYYSKQTITGYKKRPF